MAHGDTRGASADSHAQDANTRYSSGVLDFDLPAVPAQPPPTLDAESRLRAEAARITSDLDKARAAVAAAEQARRDCMEKMHFENMPWTQIGAAFGVSSTAALYATGRASRQKKK